MMRRSLARRHCRRAHDVAALNAGDADDVLEELVVVAGVAGRAEVTRVAAEAGEVRLHLGIEAVARVLGVVERVVVERQARRARSWSRPAHSLIASDASPLPSQKSG